MHRPERNLNTMYFAATSSSPSLSSSARQQAVTSFSPYLNYDPRLLQQAQPEFIFPEGASKQRGRFELAFSQIGSSVMVSYSFISRRILESLITLPFFCEYQIGAALGGSVGLYNGIRTTALANQTGKLRRTQ